MMNFLGELWGLCKNCGWPVAYIARRNGPVHADLPAKWYSMSVSGEWECGQDPDPVWMLSSEQIRVINDSVEFYDWCISKQLNPNFSSSLYECLDENPGLLFRILERKAKEVLA